MATITSNGTGGGNWGTGSTWVGGAVPADNDTVVIAAGDTVVFNVDTSAFANGVNGLTITGTLTVSTTTSSYLKMKAATLIVGAGTFNIGTSATPIPFAVKFTLNGGAGWYIDANAGLTMTVYGATPVHSYVTISAPEAVGQTVLSVDTDVTGDIWTAGDTVCIGGYNTNKSESMVIAAGGIGATSITITSPLVNAMAAGSLITLVTRNIQIIGGATSLFYRFNNAGKLTMDGAAIIGGLTNTAFSTVNYAQLSNVVFHNFLHVFYIVNYGVFTNCVFSAQTITNSDLSSNTTCTVDTATDCIVCGLGTAINFGIGSQWSGGVCVGGTYGIYGMQNGFVSNVRISTQTGIRQNGASLALYNVLFTGTEINWLTAPLLSIDHNQVAGAYKYFEYGGDITVSQASVLPSGYTLAYMTTLVSADIHGLVPFYIKVPAGKTFSIEVCLRKTVSMSYLPRMVLMQRNASPLLDTPMDSFVMTNSTNTWETDTFEIDNSAGTTDLDRTLWLVCKNATGSVYSAYDITTQGGGGGAVKIMPLGRVGL